MTHYSTHKVAFMFAPIVIIWLLCIVAVGAYNVAHWNPSIVQALSPYYLYRFFREMGKEGASILCIKSVHVPIVPDKEHYLIGRIGPKEYRMYRCIVRYRYKDLQKDDEDFENRLLVSVVDFIQMEAEGSQVSDSDSPSNERMTVVSSHGQSAMKVVIPNQDGWLLQLAVTPSRSCYDNHDYKREGDFSFSGSCSLSGGEGEVILERVKQVPGQPKSPGLPREPTYWPATEVAGQRAFG
eukprot:Gb_23135 [translate_table: standard]